jgi:hypothetical protein
MGLRFANNFEFFGDQAFIFFHQTVIFGSGP